MAAPFGFLEARRHAPRTSGAALPNVHRCRTKNASRQPRRNICITGSAEHRPQVVLTQAEAAFGTPTIGFGAILLLLTLTPRALSCGVNVVVTPTTDSAAPSRR